MKHVWVIKQNGPGLLRNASKFGADCQSTSQASCPAIIRSAEKLSRGLKCCKFSRPILPHPGSDFVVADTRCYLHKHFFKTSFRETWNEARLASLMCIALTGHTWGCHSHSPAAAGFFKLSHARVSQANGRELPMRLRGCVECVNECHLCVCVSTCFILPSSWSGIVDPNLTLSYYSWVELTPKCSQASGPHCSVKSLGSREHGAAQILDQVTAR